MNFDNQTPFPALNYVSADPDRKEHDVVVMKVSYKIVKVGESEWDLQLIKNGSVPLCMIDEFWGEMGQSSIEVESDLTPYKPKCDVILNGHAYTPHGKEMTVLKIMIKIRKSSVI